MTSKPSPKPSLTPTWVKIAADNICNERAALDRLTVRKLIWDAFQANVYGYQDEGECFSCGCEEKRDGTCTNQGCYRVAPEVERLEVHGHD